VEPVAGLLVLTLRGLTPRCEPKPKSPRNARGFFESYNASVISVLPFEPEVLMASPGPSLRDRRAGDRAGYAVIVLGQAPSSASPSESAAG
jgi:hypothetical protein